MSRPLLSSNKMLYDMFAHKGSHGDGLGDSGDQNGKPHGCCNLWFDAEGRKSKGGGVEGEERVGWSSLWAGDGLSYPGQRLQRDWSRRCQDNRLRTPVFNNVSR
jgi:hypothetical protein